MPLEIKHKQPRIVTCYNCENCNEVQRVVSDFVNLYSRFDKGLQTTKEPIIVKKQNDNSYWVAIEFNGENYATIYTQSMVEEIQELRCRERYFDEE